MSELQAFHQLTPEILLDALESTGLVVDSGLTALNSYENRVYRFKTEQHGWCVAKFYRPARWTDAQINEELQFCLELAELELPVVVPMALNQQYLHHCGPYRFSLFPSVGGRAFVAESDDEFERLGRLLGRVHAQGAQTAFKHRPRLDVQRLGWDNLAVLEDYLAGRSEAQAYLQTARELLTLCQQQWDQAPPRLIRLHGDCHLGNLLVRDECLTLLDFDDSGMGPAIQDVWMLLNGDDDQRREQLYALLAGYEDFHPFDWPQLQLVEVYRSLRLIYYSAWLARRWQDPAFPVSFPWFARPDYWPEQQRLLALQRALLVE